MDRTSGSPPSGSACSRCAARSRARSRPRASRGKIGKGVDAVVYVASAPEEQWRPLLEAKGEALLTTAVQRLGRATSAARRRRTRYRYESQDIPGLVPRGGARPGAGLEEVRALLDVERARGGGRADIPTLCERCAPVVTRAPPVTAGRRRRRWSS